MNLTKMQTNCLKALKMMDLDIEVANIVISYLKTTEQQTEMINWLMDCYENKIAVTKEDILKMIVILTGTKKFNSK